jgi:hypothetical protein
MDIEKITKSKAYADATRKIDAWKQRLKKADRREVMLIAGEKRKFFEKMHKTNPKLYEVFEIDDKTLGEEILNKLTGEEIILD